MHIGRSPLNVRTPGRLRTMTSTELPAQARGEADPTPFTLLGTAKVPCLLGYPFPPCPQTLLHLALQLHLPSPSSLFHQGRRQRGHCPRSLSGQSKINIQGSDEENGDVASGADSECRKSGSSQDGGNRVLSRSVEELHQHHHQEKLQPRAKRHGGLALLGHEPELVDQPLLYQSLLEAVLL